jgi:hypothetical protein
MATGGEFPGCTGNVFKTGQSQEADCGVSQTGHHLWPFSLPGLVAVFMKGYVSDPVGLVLN